MAGVIYPIVLLCVCVFLNVCYVVLVFFKCVTKLTNFLFKSRLIFLSDKVLKNKAIKIAIDPKYDGYQRG